MEQLQRLEMGEMVEVSDERMIPFCLATAVYRQTLVVKDRKFRGPCLFDGEKWPAAKNGWAEFYAKKRRHRYMLHDILMAELAAKDPDTGITIFVKQLYVCKTDEKYHHYYLVLMPNPAIQKHIKNVQLNEKIEYLQTQLVTMTRAITELKEVI